MKGIYTKIIIIIVIVACMIFLINYNNKDLVKTVRSEGELYKLYKNNYDEEMNTLEWFLTLPFSLLQHRVYNEYYSTNSSVDYDLGLVKDSDVYSLAEEKDYSKTNIQVEGVDEADIIKTDGDYIYSISGNNIVITNVKNPEETFIESKIYIGPAVPNDMLLYKNYLVVFAYNSNNRSWNNNNTLVEVYDISNKTNAKRVKSFELYEPYYTSRCIDGNLYVFSRGSLRVENERVVINYKENEVTKEIDLNNIKYLKDNPTRVQTLIAHLDLNKIGDVNVQSYLIDLSEAYVSKKNVYLADQTYNDNKISILSVFTFKGIIGFIKELDEYYYDYSTLTKLYKFEIDKEKGVVFDSTTSLSGKISNQYSMDEKDNHLRIALETDEGTRVAILNENLNLIGQTDNVAKGERMYASRFIGDKAYLVTYRNTDPLFVIDLSNESNPKVMGELKIPGYSTYLHPYDETHLIGIGMNTEEVVNRDSQGKVTSSWDRIIGMKMALFDVSDVTNPKEISKTTIGDSRTVSAILSNPKALLFSKEKKLLAIPVNNYEDDFGITDSDEYDDQVRMYTSYNKKYIAEGYFVYNIDLEDGFELKGIINHEKKTNNYYYYNNSKLLRGVYIDDNLYTASEGYIKVNSLEDLKEITSLEIK